MTTPEHTIVALCQRSDAISRSKGWVKDGDPRPFHTTISLMHSELSEALEEYRDHKPLNEIYYTVKTKNDAGDIVTGKCAKDQLPAVKALDSKYGRGTEFIDAKPEGIPIELADLVIRICQRVGTDGDAARLDLCCTELGAGPLYADFELFLAERHLDLSNAYVQQKKKEMVLRNLANCINQTFDFCKFHNIDLWAAIDEKEAYNRTRSERHGGKKI
jgi:hypothetical protein